MSRHPTLPPIVTTPEPVPVRETRRKRSAGVWAKRATGATDDLDEGTLTSSRSANSTQIEAVERRVPSISGKLSDDTLKAMLQLQEASGEQSDSGATPTVET